MRGSGLDGLRHGASGRLRGLARGASRLSDGPGRLDSSGPSDGPDRIASGPNSKDFPSLKFVIIAGHISKVGRCSHPRSIQGRSQKRIMYKEPMKRSIKRYNSESFGYIINLLIVAGCT